MEWAEWLVGFLFISIQTSWKISFRSVVHILCHSFRRWHSIASQMLGKFAFLLLSDRRSFVCERKFLWIHLYRFKFTWKIKVKLNTFPMWHTDGTIFAKFLSFPKGKWWNKTWSSLKRSFLVCWIASGATWQNRTLMPSNTRSPDKVKRPHQVHRLS